MSFGVQLLSILQTSSMVVDSARHEMHIFLQVKLLVGIQPVFRSTLPVRDLPH